MQLIHSGEFRMRNHVVALIALGAALLALPVAGAAERAGDITLLTGRATAATPTGEIRQLEKNGVVYPGEMISTGPNSYLNIRFTDGGRVLLRPNSRFQIEEYRYAAADEKPAARGNADAPVQEESNALFRLLKGGFRAVTGLIGRENRDNYKVRTPVATIGIRGTDFEARFCDGDCFDVDPMPQDGLYTGVFQGGINLTNGAGTVDRDAGQFGFVPGLNQPPVGLGRRPKALSQDPMPDPEACE